MESQKYLFLIRNILIVFSIIIISGCASPGSTVLLTGTKRVSITVEQVKILPSVPENAEMIGVITANGAGGINKQKKLDTALDELKRQAALIGANVLVLEDSASAGENGQNQNKGINVNINLGPVILKGKALYVG